VTKAECTRLVMARFAGLDIEQLNTGRLTREELDRLEAAAAELMTLPIYVGGDDVDEPDADEPMSWNWGEG
jgi:hypothetical protein